jgi:hypothetical protein
MVDNHEGEVNLLDYPPTVTELQHWKGSGELGWRKSAWKGNFAHSRLLNGRLRFIFKLHDGRQSSDRFINQYPLEFEGVAEDGSQISVTGIHFNRRYGFVTCTGYAQAARRYTEVKGDTVSIVCELTNYSLEQRREDVELSLDGFGIKIARLWWGKEDSGLKEHAVAYQHAAISTQLKIENIPHDQAEKAIDCLDRVASLLSVACRGFVFIVAQHTLNAKEVHVDSLFEEPPFSDKGWGRPLISSNNIEEFLIAAYQTMSEPTLNKELGYITDHYLQALTLRSAWPIAVGIFTAMETLKSAYFANNESDENAAYNYWVVPPANFESNKAMLKEVIEVLSRHFPRFAHLSGSERDSLKDQIKHGLKRRSYKTQLKRMLSELGVRYTDPELRIFVNIRNSLVHTGRPEFTSASGEEHHMQNTSAWRKVRKAVGLFERTLLAFLNYKGPCELFDEGVG